jgi:phosphate transport system permease protein
LVLIATRPIFNAAYRLNLRELPKVLAASRELFGWFVILTLSLGLAWTLSVLFTQIGYDARGGVVDTYVQRNALVVAFAIAFAEIPIIYTISEDALNAVPSYLRSGSLACGASRWQTTAWIVLPTAASGIFSAIMIGLGRAVGETMIVVMATGNTPILDVNIFNGLRTLSANINVELPEAVRDSTLYRTLFLCALVLFAMTFVINTIAELVRQRYRKRAAQL